MLRAALDLAWREREPGLGRMLERAAERHGAACFVEYGRERLSFSGMNLCANRVAAQLERAGLRAGGGVALLLTNHPRFLEVLFAVQKLGAYAVPLDPGLGLQSLAFALNDSRVEAVVLDHLTAPQVVALREYLSGADLRYVSRIEASPDYELPEGMRDYDDLCRSGPRDDDERAVAVEPDAPRAIFYGEMARTAALADRDLGSRPLVRQGLLRRFVRDRWSCGLPLHRRDVLCRVAEAVSAGVTIQLTKRA
jgi:acyl-CoA synthetase (AMP-forming)/AMP-acid ligase II